MKWPALKFLEYAVYNASALAVAQLLIDKHMLMANHG